MRRWIERFAELVAADAERLTSLDAAIGDGDHGTNLDRGLRAAVASLDAGLPPGKVLIGAGRALIAKTGGASGPLYGTALRRAGKALDASAGSGAAGAAPADGEASEVDADSLGTALRAMLEAVRELGGAAEGDKTMVDALAPAVAAYEAAAGEGPAAAARAALAAAQKGAEATVPLRARKGRASYLGERSIGHLDPGAASTVLLFQALADTTEDRP